MMYTETARKLLGIESDAPLENKDIAQSLKITCFPAANEPELIKGFRERLIAAFIKAGIKVTSWNDALKEGKQGNKIPPGYAILATGEDENGNIATDYVSSLSENIIVGLFNAPCPAHAVQKPQKKIDAIIQDFVFHIVQLSLYIEQTDFTICTLNGTINKFPIDTDLDVFIQELLLIKLGAPVRPPQPNEFENSVEPYDASLQSIQSSILDMVNAGPLLEKTGTMLYQTKLADLNYRSKKHRRIASAFVDRRSGMSYGFISRQLPSEIEISEKPCGEIQQLTEVIYRDDNGEWWFHHNEDEKDLYIKLPEIRVLCTRSGCKKHDLNPTQDIVLFTLDKGKIRVHSPADSATMEEVRPSYDMRVILAHALANHIIAGIKSVHFPSSSFVEQYKTKGLAQIHWHGYLDESAASKGTIVFGKDNPPFSCSTPQSAIIAFDSKIRSFLNHPNRDIYSGDIHVEPYHGTNATGASVYELIEEYL